MSGAIFAKKQEERHTKERHTIAYKFQHWYPCLVPYPPTPPPPHPNPRQLCVRSADITNVINIYIHLFMLWSAAW